jgi:ankyrin repeat protein
VQALLKAPGIDVNISDDRRKTALHCAAYNGHLEIVSTLLDAGAWGIGITNIVSVARMRCNDKRDNLLFVCPEIANIVFKSVYNYVKSSPTNAFLDLLATCIKCSIISSCYFLPITHSVALLAFGGIYMYNNVEAFTR